MAKLRYLGLTLLLVTVTSTTGWAVPKPKKKAAPPAKPAPTLKVMTFNVMCDFCAKGNAGGSFSDRLLAVADTINRNNPDLISLQEMRTSGQVKALLSYLHERYTPIYADGFFLAYPDPTLLVRENRFGVVERDGFWLGPNSPSFGFGWKTSFPRRIEFTELRDSATDESLIFAGTHFDNAGRNREPSAELLVKKFGNSHIPVIFAGDTNLRPDRPGYATLTTNFRDAFREVDAHPYLTNHLTKSTDGCNLEKAPDFPECRVDHVLLSKNNPWKVKSWSVDTHTYNSTNGFISDHRAVIVELRR